MIVTVTLILVFQLDASFVFFVNIIVLGCIVKVLFVICFVLMILVTCRCIYDQYGALNISHNLLVTRRFLLIL